MTSLNNRAGCYGNNIYSIDSLHGAFGKMRVILLICVSLNWHRWHISQQLAAMEAWASSLKQLAANYNS